MCAQWARFSAIERTIEQVCKQDLAEVFATYAMKLTHVKEIGWDAERGKFGEIVSPFLKCEDIDEALRTARGWKGLALSFNVEDMQSYEVMLNLWPDPQNRTNVCLDLSPEMVWYESEEYEPGMWVLGYLLAFTAALKANCCGFGRDPDYSYVYAPLDCARVISRLKDRSLFRAQTSIHLISTKLISSAEVRAAMEQPGVRPGFVYRESVTGYHVVYNIR